MASSTNEPTNGCGYWYCGVDGLYFQVTNPVDPLIEPTEETPNPVNCTLDEVATYEEYWAHAKDH